MKLLVQADDYGFTKGVTYGILEAIDNGVLTATGMFANMDIAPWAAKFIKERPDFCFGIDFNLVSGPAISPKEKIPHLVDEEGNYIRSGIRIKDPRWQSEEGRTQMIPYEEAYTELRAHFERFVELTGRKPSYIHGHSITTETMQKAMRDLGKEENIPVSLDYLNKFFSLRNIKEEGEDNVSQTKVFDAAAQVKKDPLGKAMKYSDELLKHDLVMLGGHPGFVDAELFKLTTLSIERAKDLELVMSPWLKEFVKRDDVELIDYRDLVKMDFE